MRMPTLAAAALAVSAALVSAGCCCSAPPACAGPPHGVFAHDSCDPPCADECAAGPLDAYLSCGRNGPCPKHHGSRGLLGFLEESLCCTSGCGELYLHPWINDPPAPCDPCDDCGHWTGPKHFCGPAGCGAGACPVGWRGLLGHRSDLAYGVSPAMHAGHYDGEIIAGPVLHGPTPADPLLAPGEEELEEEDLPPAPPARPRSALKKVDGQPAAYYSRRPQP